MSPNACRRLAFAKGELLLIVAILVVVAGIVAPAVLKVREAAARMGSQNNLKQISISISCMADATNGLLPPSVGQFRADVPSTALFFHILPYVESDPTYSRYRQNPDAIPLNEGNFKVYRAPGDPTLTDAPSHLTSYASNAAVFGLTDGGTVHIKVLARRGTNSHVLFMERYAVVGPEQTRHTWNGRGDRDNYLYPPSEAFDPDNMAAPQFGLAPTSARNDAPHAFIRKTFQAAMADGNVRTLTPEVTRTFTYADGQRATIWAWACSLNGPLGTTPAPDGW